MPFWAYCTGVTFGQSMSFVLLPARSTYGRPIARREFDGFGLSLSTHSPGEVVPKHRHAEDYLWCLTVRGGFEERSGARQQECGPGSLLVRPPDCVHEDRFNAAPGLCLNLFPQGQWLERIGLQALSDTHTHARSRRLLDAALAIADELCSPDVSATLSIESLMVEALERCARHSRFIAEGCAPWLAAVLEQIEAQPAVELSLSALAKIGGVSAGHLARTFRARFGKSVGAYVRERRLAFAARTLRGKPCRLSDVAAATGFHDQAHFTRAFKAQYGLTPAAFARLR
ncbi:MAG: helix-turn-helix transcriptional regulator [Alphaproteobacteria bacterium]|nr:helix-turn-helix transcriptional regulator [Alphaproteobacteria bacterium]